ncbi:MAG: HEAT repeat domain-containing protein [Saprospiraceae bacterium]|nr:HEAT repeat domain-containing protein [Saprospiraceae bacterium]
MTEVEINRLTQLYQTGQLNHDEWQKLEHAIEQGLVDINQITILSKLKDGIQYMGEENTPAATRMKVLEMIENEQAFMNKERIVISKEWVIRTVLAAAAMITGLIIGVVVRPGSAPKQDVALLRSEMVSLKETMLLTLLEKETVTDRLRAVSYSYDLDPGSQTVIEALFATLNEDNNINVRLAAVEALQRYGTESWVRIQLVKSITLQESPLVQVALAECMVALKEKSSIQEFQKLINAEETPEAVKSKLKGCIQQII